jgi:hypothetical protein
VVAGVLIAPAAEQPAAAENKGTMRVCTTRKGKRTCRRVAIFRGHAADRDKLRTAPLDRPSGDIAVRAPSLSQSLALNIYRADGALDDGALARLDEVFRCKRSHEVRAVDPRLYEMLSRIYDHFGKREVELVSGFRFKERDSSRHYHAAAMDIRISGVSIKQLYAFAESLDAGGMGIGIYPTSGFVHVDFRAPGEPSYRWTDLSGPGGGRGKRVRGKTVAGKGKPAPVKKAAPAKKAAARRPTS